MFSNKKFIIDTNQAPRAIGPYSQAVSYNGMLFVSGQIPVDPNSGEVNMGGIEAQTRQAMNNLQAVLMAAGLDFSHVLKTTVFLRNMNDYKLMNDVYALYFDYSPPARACIEVSRLPKDVLVEIECIAAAPTDYDARTTSSVDSDVPADQWEADHIATSRATHEEIQAEDAAPPVDAPAPDISAERSADDLPAENKDDTSDAPANDEPELGTERSIHGKKAEPLTTAERLAKLKLPPLPSTLTVSDEEE